jgi:hypothetical protein
MALIARWASGVASNSAIFTLLREEACELDRLAAVGERRAVALLVFV